MTAAGSTLLLFMYSCINASELLPGKMAQSNYCSVLVAVHVMMLGLSY